MNLHGKVDVDSVAETNEENNHQDPPKVKAVLFFADVDKNSANRLQKKLSDLGYDIELCDFLVAGKHYHKVISEYMENCNILFWLATPTAIRDKGLMEHILYVGQYKGVQEPGCLFIPLVPQEHLSLKMPVTLDAVNPLHENDSFEERAKATLKNVLKNTKKSKKNPTVSSASTSAIANENFSALRQVSASSDAHSINEPAQQINEESDQFDLCADRELQIQPITYREPGQDVVSDQVAGNQLQPDGLGTVNQVGPAMDQGQPITNIFNINITGANSQVQIGSHNQIMQNQPPDETSAE